MFVLEGVLDGVGVGLEVLVPVGVRVKEGERRVEVGVGGVEREGRTWRDGREEEEGEGVGEEEGGGRVGNGGKTAEPKGAPTITPPVPRGHAATELPNPSAASPPLPHR